MGVYTEAVHSHSHQQYHWLKPGRATAASMAGLKDDRLASSRKLHKVLQ